MKTEETLFCNLLDFSLHPETHPVSEESRQQIAEYLPALTELARIHGLTVALYDILCQLSIPLSAEQDALFVQSVSPLCYKSYCLLSFTKKVLSILSELPITYFLIKGVSLLPSYPKLEYRQYDDVDILIPDPKEYLLAKNHLLTIGFIPKKDLTDHHLELLWQDGNTSYLLELHSKVIAGQSNQAFNERVQTIYRKAVPQQETFPEAGISYPVFSPTQNTLYLLLHMLQHFLSAGFGIRLLYDWTAYLEDYARQISFLSLRKETETLGLSGFCSALAYLCQHYLGLSPAISRELITEDIDNNGYTELMTDILEAGKFGKTNKARFVIMHKGNRFSQYFHELHRQMKKRFPKLQKCFPLRPFLWLITLFCFLWNNHFLRKTKTRQLLAMSYQRQKLLTRLKLFSSRQK